MKLKNTTPMIDQEFYNEIMSEACEAERLHEEEIDRKNALVVKTLIELKGFDYTSKFLHDFVESECHGEITFCEKPTGNQQSDTWGAIKRVWVDQYCEMEDSYWGYIYWPVGPDNYLKCGFAC